MQFEEKYTYDAPLDDVWKMLSDPDYDRHRADLLHLSDVTVQSSATPETINATTTAAIPTDQLPDAARRFVKNGAKGTLQESWKRAGDEATGKLSATASGIPASVTADITLTGAGQTTTAVMRGDVKVRIPLLGARLEQQAVRVAPLLAKGEIEASKKFLGN